MNTDIETALLVVLCIALLGAALWDLKHLWLIRRFKRWLKNTPEETIIETHIRVGYIRTDSDDQRITTLRKGKSMLTITRDSAPNDADEGPMRKYRHDGV